MAQHDIAVVPGFPDSRDMHLLIRYHVPLVGFFLHVDGGVIRAIDIFLKGISLKVIVRGTDVAVADKFLRQIQRVRIVFRVVFRINDDRKALVFVLKIEEGLFLVAENEDDIRASVRYRSRSPAYSDR